MKYFVSLLILSLTSGLQAASPKRPTCEDDFVPYGLEIARVSYALKCGYIPKKMQRYYSTSFDAKEQKLVRQTQFTKYPIFAKRNGMQWTVWKPESSEKDYPDSCGKPQDIEWVGSCVR